ncbi:hypothetical protein PtA15_4A841 [Puccinia triticina]|uniref:Eukaryotic translation initiation factor 3 subunit A n=1 Tax=Puccinia triticina TaxID=208348 RepID=A0ABY7CJ44_9BASI|nr:uncharacterized protein PtA15_4A841 [Puccinia triticina]WAQ84388.1 hypothetical protein PtA15_4A841 [Puccinia triticina]
MFLMDVLRGQIVDRTGRNPSRLKLLVIPLPLLTVPQQFSTSNPTQTRKPYTKPETVLRRSEELLSVNQPMSALASISEIFSSKRFRQTPLSSLEPIMLRFIDLCVLLRKTRNVKEGLHMYKNVAQNTSVSSVEMVIQHFITKSKEKLVEALAKVDEIEGPLVTEGAEQEIAAALVDDLEATETPESLLMSTVSEEKSRDRTYRELVTPWLRSLWEAYRTALDILRNNSRLENFYQQIATEAFEFCLTHTRKTEFRRLAETLRSNLASSQKYTNQAHSINLSDPDVLQRHLETRFQQLNTSVKLELWQESFRTAEDIHGLIGLSKKVPKSHVMSAFYEKMIKVFGVGENHLFHAAAYNKYFTIQANIVADQPEKLKKLSGLVLLSALAVPVVGPNTSTHESHRKVRENEEDANSLAKTKLGRLASLLGLTSLPTRANLLKDALMRGVLKKSSPELRSLYEILEVDFHPLSITSKIQPILQQLSEDEETKRYLEPLKEVVLTRLFQQLSQVYDSLKLNRVIKLASFGDSDPENLRVTRIRVEKFLMEACKRGELEVTLDHSSQLIKFTDRLFENDTNNQISSTQLPMSNIPSLLSFNRDQDLVPTQSLTKSGVLQPNSASLLRTHLTRLASALTVSLNHIMPVLSTINQTTAPDLDLVKSVALQALQIDGPKQRKMLQKRKVTIEERKRKVEELKQKQDIEEAKAKALRIIQIQEEQQIRLQKQNKEREIKKLKDEADKIRAAEAEKVAIALAAQAGLNVDIKNLKGVDTNMIIQMGVEQIEKEKKELAAKMKTVNKRLDHTERALRREEIPLLEEDYKLQQTRDEANMKKLQQEFIEGLQTKHANEVTIKHKLKKMMPDFLKFKERVANQRGHDYKKAKEESLIKIEQAKIERRAQVVRERKLAKAKKLEEERLAKEKEAEELRMKEEAERLEEERKKKQAEIEEQDRIFRAEAEAKAKAMREEREKERAAAAESAARQAQREAEAMAKRENRKLAERAAAPLSSTVPAVKASEPWRRPGMGDSGAAPVSGVTAATATGEVRSPMVPAPAEIKQRPTILPGAAKAGGWRERMAAKGGEEADSGASSGGDHSPAVNTQRNHEPSAEDALRPPPLLAQKPRRCQSRNGPAPRRAPQWPARPSRIPCRVHSGGLARARPRSPAAARRAEGPRLRLSSCPLERTLVSEPHQRTLFLPVSRARHALSPCLSAPSTIRCSLSTREPGGCKQLLQRLSRPAPAQPPGPASLSHGKAYTLSPSWCSPSIHRAARKHTRPANPILSVFLKNNGGAGPRPGLRYPARPPPTPAPPRASTARAGIAALLGTARAYECPEENQEEVDRNGFFHQGFHVGWDMHHIGWAVAGVMAAIASLASLANI